MMKKTIMTAASLLICTLIGAPSADAKKTELSFSATVYETHILATNALKPLMEIIEQVSGGNIECTFFNPGTICPGNEIIPNVATGVLDYGLSNLAQTKGRYPLWTVIELPLIFNSAAHIGAVCNKLYEEFPELREELTDFVPFNMGGSTPYVLLTTFPINKLEDLAGKKIGFATSSCVGPVQALGASPVVMPATDLYMALQRGMIEGTVFPIPSIGNFKLQEVAKHLTLVPLLGGTNFGLFNKKTWESLPEEYRKGLEPYMGMRAMVSFTNCSDGVVPAEKEKLTAGGVTITELSPEELARWAEKLSPVYEAWIADMESKGLKSARAIFDRTRQLAAEYTPEKLEELQKSVEPFNKPIAK